jgi:chemotaxis protein histidine kinase CheA
MESFIQKVSDLIEKTENEIDALNEMVNNQQPTNEAAAKANAMQQMSQQYGLSPEEMAKMQSGKMSAAEKQAMANKVLQQQTNMSMGEVQNLSKMSDAGKKAYAEAYGAEMMATAQTDPNQQQKSESAKNMQQLISSQQSILGKINTNSQKIGNMYANIQNDPELKKMQKNIEEWNSKIMAMSGVDYGQGKQMDSLAVLIKTTQIKICDKYTPKYRSVLRQHLPVMKASLPDIQQLGEVTAELTKAQTGILPPAESTEIGKLQAIKGYLSNLKDAYQFKLYFPEDS